LSLVKREKNSAQGCPSRIGVGEIERKKKKSRGEEGKHERGRKSGKITHLGDRVGE